MWSEYERWWSGILWRSAYHASSLSLRVCVITKSIRFSKTFQLPVETSKPTLKCGEERVFVVMDFIEHDLKSLLTVMPSPFLQSEVKTLMLQLLSAVKHCHQNWILHRDLKTSNLLMNNRGTIKVADFGLARRYGDPVGVGGLTQLVVTLWYRYVSIS